MRVTSAPGCVGVADERIRHLAGRFQMRHMADPRQDNRTRRTLSSAVV